MPTIFWKKIGKGSWINIGGSDTFRRIQLGTGIPLGTRRRRGQRIPALQYLVNETYANALIALPPELRLANALIQ